MLQFAGASTTILGGTRSGGSQVRNGIWGATGIGGEKLRGRGGGLRHTRTLNPRGINTALSSPVALGMGTSATSLTTKWDFASSAGTAWFVPGIVVSVEAGGATTNPSL